MSRDVEYVLRARADPFGQMVCPTWPCSQQNCLRIYEEHRGMLRDNRLQSLTIEWNSHLDQWLTVPAAAQICEPRTISRSLRPKKQMKLLRRPKSPAMSVSAISTLICREHTVEDLDRAAGCRDLQTMR